MAGDSLTQRKAQLDKAEREHLEDVVTEMRDRVKENVRFQLTQQSLDEPPGRDVGAEHVASLAEAIEQEAVDGEDWTDGFEQFVNGVGYTVVIRLAALRCLEVRGFVERQSPSSKPASTGHSRTTSKPTARRWTRRRPTTGRTAHTRR